MKKAARSPLSLLLLLALAAGLLSPPASAAGYADPLCSILHGTAAYLYAAAQEPQVGSVGGEWAVLGLARSGYPLPDTYCQAYCQAVSAYLGARKGILHDKKYTEYSRLVITLTALGQDPSQAAGKYNLLTPLGDYDKTIQQGVNGAAWALIALDSGRYTMPQNPAAATQATRQMYLDYLLSHQLTDGGFSLSGQTADPDLTAMVLQALSNYQEQDAVAQATQNALNRLSSVQNADGSFTSGGTRSSESVSQVIIALCALGIPLDDQRFCKDGRTLLDCLLDFRQEEGGFLHTLEDAGSSQMSTEQALCALAADRRLESGAPSLYRISDPLALSDTSGEGTPGEGLPGKDPAVTARPVVAPGLTFPDVSGDCLPAIESLAARGIINGKAGGRFDPGAGMTRAEFAAIVIRGLGLPLHSGAGEPAYSDVAPDQWHSAYIETASHYGIITGVGGGQFAPERTLTRQEAAVMTARAAQLCGLDTTMDTAAIQYVLPMFLDYTASAAWSRPALAFCYQADIWDRADLEIRPLEPAKRCEVAQMLFRLLGRANLL